MIVSNINNMNTATERLQQFFDNLLASCDQTTKNQEDQILLAGSMMAVAKILYHNNLSEIEFQKIMDHNGRDLLNLIKPTIH